MFIILIFPFNLANALPKEGTLIKGVHLSLTKFLDQRSKSLQIFIEIQFWIMISLSSAQFCSEYTKRIIAS